MYDSVVFVHRILTEAFHSSQEPKPAPYVAQSKESAEFYGNRIIKDFKEKLLFSEVI